MMQSRFLQIILHFAFSMVLYEALSQVCTISGSGTINWVNASPPTCVEGGTAGGASIIRIPVGVTLNFDSNADTWTGTRIEVFGTLHISAPGQVTINSNVVVKNGGLVSIQSKLNLGSTSGCGYTLVVETGGTVDIVGGAADRLNICGVEIARGGGGGCNPYPTGPLPYCEPTGGFTGPTGFDQSGYNPALPVSLLYFVAEVTTDGIQLKWATVKEEAFDRFIIQRAVSNFNFEDIGELRGAAYDTYDLQSYEFIDTNPIIGTNYYRLKAIDLDGSFEYFGPESKAFTGNRKIWVVPNPISDGEVRLKMNFLPSEGDEIQIINQDGRALGVKPTYDKEEVIIQGIPLKPGVYVLLYTSFNFSTSTRFMVLK